MSIYYSQHGQSRFGPRRSASSVIHKGQVSEGRSSPWCVHQPARSIGRCSRWLVHFAVLPPIALYERTTGLVLGLQLQRHALGGLHHGASTREATTAASASRLQPLFQLIAGGGFSFLWNLVSLASFPYCPPPHIQFCPVGFPKGAPQSQPRRRGKKPACVPVCSCYF